MPLYSKQKYVILEYAEANLHKHYTNQTINNNLDSQAALLTLDSNIVSSRLVEECMKQLHSLGNNNRIGLRWVPGYTGIIGNKHADALARVGAPGTQQGPEPFCSIAKSLVQRTS